MSTYPKGYVIDADRPEACRMRARSTASGGGCDSPWTAFLAVNKGKWTGENWREKASKAYQRQCKKYANMDRHARRRGVAFPCDATKVVDSDYWTKRKEKSERMSNISAIAQDIMSQATRKITRKQAMSRAFKQYSAAQKKSNRKKPISRSKTANKKITKRRKKVTAGKKKVTRKRVSRKKATTTTKKTAEAPKTTATAEKKNEVMDDLIKEAETVLGRSINPSDLDGELVRYMTDIIVADDDLKVNEGLERGEGVVLPSRESAVARAEDFLKLAKANKQLTGLPAV